MNVMIAKYLKDFSTPAPPDDIGSDMLDALAESPPFGDFGMGFEAQAEVDVEAERKLAYDEGFNAATEQADARHAEALEALSRAHAEEVAALRAIHEDEVVGTVHRRFHEMTQALGQQLAEQTLQILLPVYEEEFCRRAVEQLAVSVHELLQESGTSTVVVRGPDGLFERLKPLFERDGIDCRFVGTDGVDISVEINETVLVTRLSAWAQSLSEVAE